MYPTPRFDPHPASRSTSVQAHASLRKVAPLKLDATLFEAIVQAQSELISLAEADGTLVYVNPAYLRQFGRPLDEMLGSSLFDLIPASEREAVRARIDGVLTSGEPSSGQSLVQLSSGETRWVAWTNTLLTDASGRRLLHSVGRDITRQMQAEAELRASEALLARTGRMAGIGGWQLDLRTSTLTWSEETRRIHEVEPGYQPTVDEAIRFYAPEGRAAMESAVQAGIRNGTPWDLELPFVTARGRRLWVRATGEVEFDRGAAVRIGGAFQDVTERRQLRDKLEDAERMVRNVLDNLPVRVSYFDKALRYRFVNRAQCQRFGLEREQIIGRTRAELTGTELEPALASRVAAVLGGETQRFEFDDTVDGSMRRIDSQLIPDIAADGSLAGVFGIGIDVTERSVTERNLRDLTAILESSGDYIVQTDWRGTIRYLNPAARAALGFANDAPVPEGLNFSRFNTPQTNRMFEQTIGPALVSRGMWLGETTVLVDQGRSLPVSHLVIAHRDETGRIARYSAVMRDRSQQVRAEEDLRRQTAILRSVAESIPAMVAVVGADQRYRFVNGAFERWVGSSRERIVGRSVQDVIGRADRIRSQPWIDRALAGEPVGFEREYQVRGEARHLSVNYIPLWSDDGVCEGFVGVLQDISEHRQETARLTTLSQLDALTGLLNRSGLEQMLAQQLRAGEGPSLALLYVDLDRFKPVNDSHGHAVGDEVLKIVAARLKSQVRPTDTVARLGGDEFVVVLTGMHTLAHARSVADKIVTTLDRPFDIAGRRLNLGASVGVAVGVPVDGSGEELLARADAMLYRAKHHGRGCFAIEGETVA